MKKAKQRNAEQAAEQFKAACGQYVKLRCERMDYPDYDPDRADRITAELFAQGRLAIAHEGMKGLCV